jgi:hypothetical protein
MQTPFDFVSLFCPMKLSRAEVDHLLHTHGFRLQGRVYVQKDAPTESLQISVAIGSRRGDTVAKAAGGSSTLVRSRVNASERLVAERLALRLAFGTEALLGFRTASGPMSQAQLSLVRVIQRRLHAVAYDGWVFQDCSGVNVLDLRSRQAGRLSPFFLVAGFASGAKPGKPPPRYSLSDARSSPERVPLVAHLVQAQLARLPLLLGRRSTRVAARAVMAAHERCRSYCLLRPESGQVVDPSAAIRRTFSKAEIVLDEFAWYDARGVCLLSRFPGV